jgi:hypothetical protein
MYSYQQHTHQVPLQVLCKNCSHEVVFKVGVSMNEKFALNKYSFFHFFERCYDLIFFVCNLELAYLGIVFVSASLMRIVMLLHI